MLEPRVTLGDIVPEAEVPMVSPDITGESIGRVVDLGREIGRELIHSAMRSGGSPRCNRDCMVFHSLSAPCGDNALMSP